MNIDDIFGNKTFTYESLKEEGEVTVTINGTELVVVKNNKGQDEEKIILSFSDDPRKLWCGKNKRIALRGAFGPETDDWNGRQITIEPDETVSYNGKHGTRIRIPRAPKVKKVVGDAPF